MNAVSLNQSKPFIKSKPTSLTLYQRHWQLLREARQEREKAQKQELLAGAPTTSSDGEGRERTPSDADTEGMSEEQVWRWC